MSIKKEARLRRARKARGKIARLSRLPRLTVCRSSVHISVQIFTPDGASVLVAASSMEKCCQTKPTGNIKSATEIGKLIADRAITAGIKAVAFDRAGYRYHGRIKALANAARENGLDF
jgi:large subunit ribosomal protein L18